MIKRFTLLLTLLSFTLSLYSQQRIAGSEPVRSISVPAIFPVGLEPRVEMDTLAPGAFNDLCALDQQLFGLESSWGFVAGMNEFGDKEKAQLIENTTNEAILIRETWAFFGYKSVVDNGNLRMKIYNVDQSTGGPGTLLGESIDIAAEEIQYNDTAFVFEGTPFFYESPVMLDDPSFFISVDLADLYATNDTVGILHTNFGCGSGTEAFELWEDDTWISIFDAWLADVDFDINFSLFAVVEFDLTSPVKDPHYQQGHLRLYPAAPNPARESLQLNYQLETTGSVRIEVYSPDGRRLQNFNLGQLPAGRYNETLDLSQFPAGPYVYSIVTDEARVMSKFVVK